jgi:hypothetical protein
MRVLGTLLLVVASSVVSASDSRPVIIGSEEGLDACMGFAEVVGAKSGLASVRSGPGMGYREIDRLKVGQFAYVCGGTSGWISVVYGKPAQMKSGCGVTSPVPRPVPYSGVCKSGWVRATWINVLAG